MEVKKKQQIPSLGPNLGKLGFTSLTNDEGTTSNDKREAFLAS